MGESSVELVLEPKEKDLGEFTVRRVLPAPQRRTVGSFIFFDHMGPAVFPPGKGVQVRPHPHIGLATVTYLSFRELSLLPPKINEMFRATMVAASMLTFVLCLTWAMLAPGRVYWRLIAIPEHAARRLTALISLLALSLLIERGLYWCLKNSLKRRRPGDAVPGLRSFVVASDKFSFPSGHSSGAFLLATCLAFVYGAPVTAVYFWACGVALARVILGVHFPGDTLAGAVMGCSIAALSASLLGLI